MPRQPEDQFINSITEDQTGNLWIGTRKGLSLFDQATKTFLYYTITPDKNSDNGFNPVYSLASTNENRLWIGSNSTLQLFDTEKKCLIPIDDKTDGASLLPNDGIYSLFEDNTGILWIGTTSTGILKYDRNISVFPAFNASAINHPAAKNIIRSISADKNDNIYIGTDEGFVFVDHTKNTCTAYRHKVADKNSITNNYTSALLINRKNTGLWIGTFNSGLDYFDIKTKRFTHYTSGDGPGHLSSNTIYALLEDKKGNIWIGMGGGGMLMFNNATKQFKRFTYDPKAPDKSICDNSVEALLKTGTGTYLLAAIQTE